MKILHVISGLQKAAGTSVFCMELCDCLQARGVECCVAVRQTQCSDYPSKAGVPVIETVKDMSGLPFKPDIVHIHALWYPFLHRMAVWSKANRIPIVWSPHGMLAPWAMRHKRWKKCIPWVLYQKRDLKKSGLIHATSIEERKWVSDIGLANPCSVVPLGTYPQPCLEKHRGNMSKRSVLFVGRIYPVKNLDSLILAFSRLRKTFPNWRLLLVGPDQAGHQRELVILAEALGLSVTICEKLSSTEHADVVFTGAIFGTEKDLIYRDADIFVLPSHTENFGGVVLDALAFGIPCVASKKTPWGELELEGCGIWTDNDMERLEEALRKMMSLTDEKRRMMGENGRRLVASKYTWPAIAEQMTSAYKWMFQGGERPRCAWEEVHADN